MSNASVYIEYRHPELGLRTFCQFFPTGLEASQLYALTGLQGGDPTYEVPDLTSIPREDYERFLDDIVVSKVLKLEAGATLSQARAGWKGRHPLSPMTCAILDMLEALGPGARIVFFMTS